MSYHVLYKRCQIIKVDDSFTNGRKIFKSYENARRSLMGYWEDRLKEAERNYLIVNLMREGGLEELQKGGSDE